MINVSCGVYNVYFHVMLQANKFICIEILINKYLSLPLHLIL